MQRFVQLLAMVPALVANGPRLATHSLETIDARRAAAVNNVIYIVGLVVVVIAVLSFFGLR